MISQQPLMAVDEAADEGVSAGGRHSLWRDERASRAACDASIGQVSIGHANIG